MLRFELSAVFSGVTGTGGGLFGLFLRMRTRGAAEEEFRIGVRNFGGFFVTL